jgi:hypothetical protein
MYKKNDSFLVNPEDAVCNSTPQDITSASETTFIIFDKIFTGYSQLHLKRSTCYHIFLEMFCNYKSSSVHSRSLNAN